MRKFHSLEVVGRGSEAQLQVGETLNYLIQRFKEQAVQRCFNIAPMPG